jgi:hypothetical protein
MQTPRRPPVRSASRGLQQQLLVLGLLLAAAAVVAHATAPSDWAGVVAADGPPLPLPPSCTSARVVFQPVGSATAVAAAAAAMSEMKPASALVGLQLTPTTPGDYVIECGAAASKSSSTSSTAPIATTTVLHYVAVPFSPSPGRRASYVMVSDSALGDGDGNTDSRYAFWTVRTTATTTSPLVTVLLTSSAASDEPGTVQGWTAFFNEPLAYDLAGVALAAGSSWSFAVTAAAASASAPREAPLPALTLSVTTWAVSGGDYSSRASSARGLDITVRLTGDDGSGKSVVL